MRRGKSTYAGHIHLHVQAGLRRDPSIRSGAVSDAGHWEMALGWVQFAQFSHKWQLSDKCLNMQARLDRLPSMMSDAMPMSRAWSVGQLGGCLIGAWGHHFDPQACHSDPIYFNSTQGNATAFLEVRVRVSPALDSGMPSRSGPSDGTIPYQSCRN